jgi:2-polyprenyl-6-methoxyphenol hydroxylase-like FAD-dependent oxidoreductase
MQGDQEIGEIFRNFEDERRPRAERIVALARRNGNNKGEFSATGAWIRNRMLQLLIPLTSKAMDWMYAYNPCAVTPRPEMSDLRDRQAA